jgi:tetratricopeptide (TPR) repeat protein
VHGPLSEIGLIELLQLLERGGRSGVLRISGAEATPPCELHIARGEIVAIEPSAGDHATRQALAARHLITAAEASDDPGVLDRPVAARMRQQLAAQALADMVHWRQGRFDFTTGAVPTGPLALRPDALVFDLVAVESRRLELAPAMSEFRAIPCFAEPAMLGTGALPPLAPRDWRLLDLVDGTRDVAALAAALDEPLEEVAGSVQLLMASLILELRQPMPDAGEVARAAIEAGQYEEAAALLRSRLAEHPADVDAWRALGLAEVAAGRFERAIEAWQSWSNNDPARGNDAAALMQAARTMVEALRDARD